jgi:hypothetical protein
MRITRGFIIAALVALLAPMSASAQDFAISVPVQFSKLPTNVKTYAVSCEVTAPGPMRAQETMGKGTSGAQSVPAGGAFNGELKVAVTVNAGKDRTKVDAYHCWLWFTAADPASGASVDYFRWDDPTLGANPPRPFPTDKAAPLVVDLRGAIQP